MDENGWEKLAYEIVRQACRDYLIALKRKNSCITDCLERWFCSDYCYSLCGVEGKVIIERLKKMHECGERMNPKWAED